MNHATRGAVLALAGVVGLGGAVLAQEEDRSDWPSSFTVGTASQGGTYFVYGSGWANLVSEELGVGGGGEVTGGARAERRPRPVGRA